MARSPSFTPRSVSLLWSGIFWRKPSIAEPGSEEDDDTGRDDRVEILYWSSWKEKWVPTGPFGRTVLPLDDALRVIEQEGIFWTRV